MKRIFLLMALLGLAISVFAQETGEPEDDYQEEYTYEMNGPGDQHIRIGLMPFFPLNFNNQMYIGGAIQIGYHRLLTKWVAVGADFMVAYNATRGSNIFYAIPVTVGITFMPTFWRLEFPISLNVGGAFEASQNRRYFPGLVLDAEVSAFYRFSERWSFGIGSNFLYLPQWFNEEPKYDYGLFITAAALVRYHF